VDSEARALRTLLMIPGPTNVSPRVMKALVKPLINHRGPTFHKLYEEIETGLQYLFQTKNPVIPLTCSGTGGMEFAISNVVRPGDKVLVPSFGFFCERVCKAVEAYGGKPIRVEVPLGEAPRLSLVEEALEKEASVRAVVIVCNETSTGVRVPDLKDIAKATREHGSFFIADAISNLGGDPLPVDEWGIDLCVTVTQKCIAAPPGLALVSVGERVLEALKKEAPRTLYFSALEYLRYFQERRETPYTPSIPLFFALNEALKGIMEEGLEARFRRHRECALAFYEGLEKMGIKPFPKTEDFRSNTVIAARKPESIDMAKLRSLMETNYGIVIASGLGQLRDSIFRIGSMGIVSKTIVRRTLEALKGSLASLGYGG
jgi:aspartate aminotransferase-like enzyme